MNFKGDMAQPLTGLFCVWSRTGGSGTCMEMTQPLAQASPTKEKAGFGGRTEPRQGKGAGQAVLPGNS